MTLRILQVVDGSMAKETEIDSSLSAWFGYLFLHSFVKHMIHVVLFLHNDHTAKEYGSLKISACVSSGQLSSDYGTPGNTF
jgi:hypothetical protein